MTEIDDINLVFEKIKEHFENKQDGGHEMFQTLVNVTLKHRDDLEKTGELVITVDETKKALEVFMKILVERRFPDNVDARIKELVLKWLDELKKYKQN